MKLKFRQKLTQKELRQQTVAEITQELSEAKSLILFSSVDITHQAFEEFRKKLVPANAQLRFVKNTLYRVAAKELKMPEDLFTNEILTGPTAAIFVMGEDFITPVKVMDEQFGKLEGVKVKIAFLDKEVYEAVKVMEFAKIPSVDELRTKLVGTLNNPIQRFYNGLSDTVGKLVRSLDQIAKGMNQ